MTTIDPPFALVGCDRDELVTALYLSAFQPGDLQAFGPQLVAAFARAALDHTTPDELAGCRLALRPPWPAVVDPDRLDACHQAAEHLATRPGGGAPR